MQYVWISFWLRKRIDWCFEFFWFFEIIFSWNFHKRFFSRTFFFCVFLRNNYLKNLIFISFDTKLTSLSFFFRLLFYLRQQKCSLMFFQKNIFENLKLNKKFKVNKITCLILLNFQHFYFIFYFLFFYYYFHWSCSLTICLSYHYIYLNIVFNFFEKSYKNENQNIDEKNEIDEVKINLTLCFSNLLLSYVD